MPQALYRVAISFEAAVYGLIGLIAERGATDPFGDDPFAGPLTIAIDAPAQAHAPLPKAS